MNCDNDDQVNREEANVNVNENVNVNRVSTAQHGRT
jgi:hypothetical protein